MARKRVASEPVLRDWAAVDTALRDIRECRHALVELSVEKDRRIDGIKDEYTRNAVPLQNRIKRLEGDVKDYVDAHQAELCGKSRVLTFGTVGYRLSSKLVIASSKVAEAIAALKAMGKGELVRTSEALDRQALAKQPAELLESIGAYVKQSDEFYYDVEDEPVTE